MGFEHTASQMSAQRIGWCCIPWNWCLVGFARPEKARLRPTVFSLTERGTNRVDCGGFHWWPIEWPSCHPGASRRIDCPILPVDALPIAQSHSAAIAYRQQSNYHAVGIAPGERLTALGNLLIPPALALAPEPRNTVKRSLSRTVDWKSTEYHGGEHAF